MWNTIANYFNRMIYKQKAVCTLKSKVFDGDETMPKLFIAIVLALED